MVGKVRVGVIGLGAVGSALVRLLEDLGDDIEQRAGFRLEVVRAAVRDTARARDVPLDGTLITGDPLEVVADPEVDVVCELIGGIEPARTIVLDALDRGKPVVTANKELLATMGRDLFDMAEAKGVDLAFEASVGGGIPLVRALKESLAGERIRRIVGIVNGTTNLILTRMAEQGVSFEEALREAQELGYAEADPAADVEGHDAAAKCAILASIAFNARVVAGDVFRERIERVTPVDMRTAAERGFVIKHVAIAELEEEDVAVRVHPAMLPADHRWPRCATRSTRCSWRANRPGSSCCTAGAPAAGPRPPLWPATSSGWPGTWCWGGGPSAAPVTWSAGSGRWRTWRPPTTCCSTWRTVPACWPRWPGCSGRTECRSAACGRRGPARTPSWC